jgi:RND family efflux transporter MFP subunit
MSIFRRMSLKLYGLLALVLLLAVGAAWYAMRPAARAIPADTAPASGATVSANAAAPAAVPAPAGLPAPGKAALTVTTVLVQPADLALRFSANGGIFPWQEAGVGAEVQGLRVNDVRVDVGQSVQRGQVLATFAAEGVVADVAVARAALAEAQANATEALSNAERVRSLQNSGALSNQQIQQMLTVEQAARARVESAKAALDAQLVRLKHTQVLAPDSGIIVQRNVAVGAVAGPGDLFRLIRQGRLEWRAEVTSTELARVQPGTEVQVLAPGGAVARGRVRMVGPTVDSQTRAGLVYVDLLGMAAGEKLALGAAFRPGMFAKGDFVFGNSSALTVPQQAVVVRDGFSYCFVLGADGRVEKIVEARDGTEAERAVRTCNAGMMVADRAALFGWLGRVTNQNAKGEYYLTDIVGLATGDGVEVRAALAPETAVMGADTQMQHLIAHAFPFSRIPSQASRVQTAQLAPTGYLVKTRLRHRRAVSHAFGRFSKHHHA